MIVIGTFQEDGIGGFEGTLRTLSINAKLQIVPTLMQEKPVPPFRVLASDRQIGIATRDLADGCSRIDLIVHLDDPIFPGPLTARLMETEDGTYRLFWTRLDGAEASHPA